MKLCQLASQVDRDTAPYRNSFVRFLVQSSDGNSAEFATSGSTGTDQRLEIQKRHRCYEYRQIQRAREIYDETPMDQSSDRIG